MTLLGMGSRRLAVSIGDATVRRMLLGGLGGGLVSLALGLQAPPCAAQTDATGTDAGKTFIQVPKVDIGDLTLASRRDDQIRKARDYAPLHDFRLADRRVESGIDFQHHATADGVEVYKMVHYDHGNGLGVADVDGDGRPDLYFVTQEGANQLWRNLGDAKFENVTERTGIGMADVVSVAPAFADIDNDGDPDLFVSTVRMGNRLFRNEGELRFVDITESSGVRYSGHSSGAVFFDFDNDSRLDLFVTNVGKYTGEQRGDSGYWVGYQDAFSGHLKPERTERSLLYRNLGENRFEEVAEQVGLVDESWSGDASFVDLNRDGFPDLYVLNMQGDDHYYLNVGGRRFVEQTSRFFPATPWGTMGVAFFDFQNDGLMDLYLTDMHSDMAFEYLPDSETRKSTMTWSEEHLQGGDDNIFGNAFYINSDELPFEEASDRLGVEVFWPWGTSIGDLNADGFQDIFVAASMSYPFRYGINSVLLNDAGRRFLPAEFVLGVEPRRDGQVRKPWFEIECPQEKPAEAPDLVGLQDLYAACADYQGPATVLGTLGSRASAILDLDADGDLDIVTGEFNAAPQILLSDLAARHEIRFLEVQLIGTRSNRDGLGAFVRVVTPGHTYHRYVDGKSGYLSQSSVPLYFGLGGESRVERIEVDWPSGTRQVVRSGIVVDRRIPIVEEGD